VIKSHDVGTIQYIEWMILIDRVQPSFIAGVYNGWRIAARKPSLSSPHVNKK
jgi:hypothetical protein